ncbi:hypothetical protein W03_20810 [Nitrosomonas sp. PY1]|nr:hypothetical protein W03_20810 [Nitrosomonas sp. PY1]
MTAENRLFNIPRLCRPDRNVRQNADTAGGLTKEIECHAEVLTFPSKRIKLGFVYSCSFNIGKSEFE